MVLSIIAYSLSASPAKCWNTRPQTPPAARFDISLKRALAVYRAMVDEVKLEPKRLLVQAMSDSAPVAPNDTPEGRTKNRRIEIRLRPVVVEDQGPA